MKKPVRGDHQLLTPDTHSLSGVWLCEQLRGGSGASGGGASGGGASGGTLRRCLRFEDETEVEAKSRYLERQRRRAGNRAAEILAPKPDPRLYMGRNINPPPPVQVTADRGQGLARHRLSLRTEPIRETYIGCGTPGGGAGGAQREGLVSLLDPEATPTMNLPINPYSPPPQPTDTFRSPTAYVTSLMMSHRGGANQEPGTSPSAGSDWFTESQAPPTTGSDPVKEPISSDEALLPKPVLIGDQSLRLSLSRLFSTIRLSRTRAGSLDRLTSRTRTGSLDRLSPETHSSLSVSAPCASRKSSGPLKKSLSLVSISQLGGPGPALVSASSRSNPPSRF